ncbi:PQQ-binding-like beta-propeller repeat protein [Chloroflexi bacterium]|nr:PQQ-binding-like beta-propeller repeat protein [Chloroflexota bacterium]
MLLIVTLGCTRINNAQGWSGALVDGDHLIITSMDGHVMVLDRQTGKHIWKPDLIRVNEKEEGRRAVYGMPAAYEGIVFVGVYDGKLQAMEKDTGRVVETEVVSDDSEIIGGPLIHENKLFVGATDGILRSYSLEFSNQQVSFNDEWEFVVGGEIWSTPVISDGILIITSLDHNVYALEEDTGKLLWTSKTGGAVAATPVVENNTVYVGSFDSVFYAFDLHTGDEKWTFDKASNWYWGEAVIHEDTIYVPSLDGKLYALDVNSGKKEWELETKGAIVGSPAIVSDMIVVGSTDGEIRIAETSSGEVLGSCDVGERIESSITSEGSDVYFSVRDHSVRAMVVKPNGNPDEKWDAPYFSNLLKDDKNPQPSGWSPDC